MAELEELRARLAEAEETLRAIRYGEADALVITGNQGDEVHLLGARDRVYRQFIESIREGTATLSSDGLIQSCSVELAEALQLPLDRVLATAMRDHVLPDDQEALRAVLAQAGSETCRRKIRLKTSTGAPVPVYLSATLLRGAGAAPVICLLLTDLEEVISAEETLRESEERYRALFENSPDAILLTIPDGTILSANPAACRLFGRTEEDICAHGRGAVVDTSDPRLPKFLEERARSGRVAGELRFVKKDGSSFPGEVSGCLFKDATGAMRSSLIIRDVTERNQAEVRIARQLKELLRWQDVMLGREGRVQKLKREVNELSLRLGESARYPSQEDDLSDPDPPEPKE